MMIIKFVATLYLPRVLCMYIETEEGSSNFKLYQSRFFVHESASSFTDPYNIVWLL